MIQPLHIALVAVGSHGDVHPFIGLGIRLVARGHRVTVLTNGHFESLVTRNGLEYLSIGTSAEYLDIGTDPDFWNGRKAFHVIARHVAELIGRIYAPLECLQREAGDRLVMAASSLALGARVANEKLHIPMATVHLAPAVFQSVHDMAKYPGLSLPAIAPKWLRRLIFWMMNRVVDSQLAQPLNRYRAGLGLPPTKGVFKTYWHSPQSVLAMFPDWYATAQPDWPPNTHTLGFPLYDERGLTPISAELLDFLSADSPPIAFTPGSAMFQGEDFFSASAEACRLLGRRGLLLSRHADHIPTDLPPGVIHVSYAPFSELLPKCAAIVHHGGIGTAAQALAAGTPQLIQPFAHDQPDNAHRLTQLGVARSLSRSKYKPKAIARELAALIASPKVAQACRAAAEKVGGGDAIGLACVEIEALARVTRR